MIALPTGALGVALTGLLAALALMTLVWVASLFLRDISIVDIFWGLGFVLVAWTYYFQRTPDSPRQLLVPILVTLWGCRLGGYIWLRGRGKEEDYRYREMREKRGSSFAWVSLFLVFWLQAALLWVIGMPTLQVQIEPAPAAWGALDLLGLALFAIGLYFEAVGDWQMARFKADDTNRGKVMDHGLWRYTRHPNYFGDALLWWGLGTLALSTSGSWWTLLSPILMTFLILRVSGVALLERGLEDTKPKYRDYVRRTSAFIPWPPKKV